MANPNKDRGDRAERAVAAWLRDNGFPDADRSLGAGRPSDRGDITGVPLVCIQVKDREVLRVPEWMRELANQKENACAEAGVLVAKKRGTADVGEWYVALTFADLIRLMRGTNRHV